MQWNLHLSGLWKNCGISKTLSKLKKEEVSLFLYIKLNFWGWKIAVKMEDRKINTKY